MDAARFEADMKLSKHDRPSDAALDSSEDGHFSSSRPASFNSDERLLARIGYKQVSVLAAHNRSFGLTHPRNFDENSRDGRRSLSPSPFLACLGLNLQPMEFPSLSAGRQQQSGLGSSAQ